MSSVAGFRGETNYDTYCASKGAVRLLTYALAERLGKPDIRVNVIHPVTIETARSTEAFELFGTEEGAEFLESVPLGEPGMLTDVGNTVVYLASDLARYVRGESIIGEDGRTST
jgi:NAD(P)-dependent dehydrogenase (short-subunit alcohol dehydrogenase family)